MLAVALTPLYVRELEPAAFGLLALLIALQGLLARFYDLGMQNGYTRYYFENRSAGGGALDSMGRTAIVFVLCYGGVASASLWFFAPTVAAWVTGQPGNAGLVRILAFWLLADALAILPLTILRMEGRSVRYAVTMTLRLALALASNIYFVALQGWGVFGILLSYALASSVTTIALLWGQVRWRGASFSWAVLRRMLAFGLPFVPVPLGMWVIESSDRYMLEILSTRFELGLYALGYRVAQVVQLGITAFTLGWAAIRFGILERKDATAIYASIARQFTAAATLLAVFAAVVAHEVVALISPRPYWPSADVVGVLALAYVLQGLFVLMVTGMGVKNRTLPIAVIGMLGAVLNVLINLMLIPRFGMFAAALSTVAANAFLVGSSWWASQRVYPINYDWAAIGKALAIGMLAVFFERLVQSALPQPTIVPAMAMMVLTVVAMVRSGVVPRSDIEGLGRWTKEAWVAVGQR